METTSLLLLQELLIYELEKMSKSTEVNALSANLRTIGGNIGHKAMLKISSSAAASKTKGVQACMKFFVEFFWEFVFGKKIEKYQIIEPNRLIFTDPDCELITRISACGPNSHAFQEHCKNLVRNLIEGGLEALNIKNTVEIAITDARTVQFSVECSEMTY